MNFDCCDNTAKQIKKIQPIQNSALSSKFVVGSKQSEITNALAYQVLSFLQEILLNATNIRNEIPEYILIEMTVDSEYNFGIGIRNETKRNLEYFFRNSDKVLAYFFLASRSGLRAANISSATFSFPTSSKCAQSKNGVVFRLSNILVKSFILFASFA